MALVRNYDFEFVPPFTAAQTADGWIDGTATGSATNDVYGWWASPRATAIAVQFDTTVSHSGSSSLKISTTNVTGRARIATTMQSVGQIVANSTNLPYLIPVAPSTTYKVSAWLKTTTVVGASIALTELNASFVVGANIALSSIAGTNGWTYVTASGATSVTGIYLSVGLANDTAGNVSDAWFDDVIVSGPGIGPGQVIGRSPFPGNVPPTVWRDKQRAKSTEVAASVAPSTTITYIISRPPWIS